MTDRLAYLPPPRLVVPLVLLLLAGILWIPVRNTRHSPPADTVPIEALPVELTRTEQIPPPGMFPAGERLESIPTPTDRSPLVREAGFAPTGQSPGFETLAASSVASSTPGRLKPAGPMLAAPGLMLADECPKRLPLIAPCPVPCKNGLDANTVHTNIKGDGSSGMLTAPLPAGPVQRSEQLERIAREADIHTRRGFGLASRGAHFSARAEFVRALRLVAQGLDAEHRTDVHSRALSAGLTALKEAEDFIPRGSRLEADLDMRGIVGGHSTPVLKHEQLDKLAPLEALQCYFTYGQQQLAIAVRPELAGSMALHALGKLHARLAGETRVVLRAAEPKAIVFYQAALLADPLNYMAANDLGVFLARSGRCEDAERLLRYSLGGGQPVSWRNLAVVYRQLGRMNLAEQAESRWRLAAGGSAKPPVATPTVRWMEPTEFAQSSPRPPNAWYPGQPTPPVAQKKPDSPTELTVPGSTAPPKIVWWWPWDHFFK